MYLKLGSVILLIILIIVLFYFYYYYYYYKTNIHIFLLCYNESVLLPHAIKHYKKYLPSCKITIYDNESTDNSVKIAKKLGCNVITFNTNNKLNDYVIMHIKNNCWKHIHNGWIIVGDMDEFLCVTENELNNEKKLGTTILNIEGYDMIGESNSLDLSDIDLQYIKKYNILTGESKNMCFLRENIKEMNYCMGAHYCNPIGNNIKYSINTYINKHMSSLGLSYLINKHIKRYERAHDMRKLGYAVHYLNDNEKIKNNYIKDLNNCKLLY